MERGIVGSVVAVIALGVTLGGCNPAQAPAAGSTGAFGIVSVNGKQKLYLPLTDLNSAGHGAIAVVDVGAAGNGAAGAPAQMAAIDLGTTDYATTTGGDAETVVAASTDFPTVWLINPQNDTVIKTLSVDTTDGVSNFSGGGGFVTGIAMDSANHRAILSVWNGFALLDTRSGAITQVIQAPPSENFGFDSVAQRIIAPFYDCSSSSHGSQPPAFCNDYKATDGTVMTDGLNVIDLKDGTVYTYQDAAAADPHRPVGGEPDSAAVDPNTGVAIIPSEGDGFENVIDFSKATFDKATRTVTAPHQYIKGQGLTGVAVEATRHYAFFEEEHSSDIGIVDVTQANQGKGVFLHAYVPDLPDKSGSSWSNLGDPHGIAVTTGLSNGLPVGFVVDSSRMWVARVDLTKMLALPQTQNQIQASDMASAITFLGARQHP